MPAWSKTTVHLLVQVANPARPKKDPGARALAATASCSGSGAEFDPGMSGAAMPFMSPLSPEQAQAAAAANGVPVSASGGVGYTSGSMSSESHDPSTPQDPWGRTRDYAQASTHADYLQYLQWRQGTTRSSTWSC